MGTMVQSGAGFLLNCPLSFTPSPSSSSLSPSPWSWKAGGGLPLVSASSSKQKKKAKGFQVGAFFFDPAKDPIIKDALKVFLSSFSFQSQQNSITSLFFFPFFSR
ncbi:OLC1v1011962C1 [Oldenlandia corymbosa var. corymbosa]|uniref:OLC1v1011962C1 n=1 Tax=Oldenlandia corymbosa var. corymbosa TaxID=529605 RepID=A0AAV1DY75_OLDCO|nr:OLC1v1011962C1 [Oldenlandia corymbosa var. corymbosa]